jgi:hypothetical protein
MRYSVRRSSLAPAKSAYATAHTRSSATTRTPARPGIGNQVALRRLSAIQPRLQARLEIGAANDPLEHEADAVAEQIMRMPARISTGAPAKLVRKCAACEEEQSRGAPGKCSACAAKDSRSDGTLRRQGAPAAHIFRAEGVTITLRSSCATVAGFSFAIVEAAVRDALDKIFNSTCIEATHRHAIQANLRAHGFEFRAADSATLENAGACAEGTGFSIPANIVTLGTAALQASCGPLASTVLHEIIHIVRGFFGEALPRSCEASCYAQPGDPTLCRDTDVSGHRNPPPGPAPAPAPGPAPAPAPGPAPAPAPSPKQPAKLQRAGGTGEDSLAGTTVPASVHSVLGEPGEPLDAGTRGFMEARFGYDFGDVRIHHDARAAASAQDVGALGYAVGEHLVFDAGQYAPGSASGRRLIAHELAHVVQNDSAPTLRRVCNPSPLPAAPLPVGAALPFRYEAAERCLQTYYAATHPAKPGISLSFNFDWLSIRGGTANEKAALGCLRGGATPGAGPNFTGKSGMSAGSPDIWDFANQTMYEITTSNGAAERIPKLGREIAQANAITEGFDCGGMRFDRGSWVPTTALQIDAGLYITVVNNQGVLIYTVIKDATAEVTAVFLATLAVLMKKMMGGGQGGGQAPVPAPARTALAVGSLAAIAIMLAAGKAQAKVGPSEEEPLVQLFQSLSQQGVTVPPEVQQLIESDSALKQKITDAMTGKGSPTAAQQAVTEATMKLIQAGPDQFSAQDLEALVSIEDIAAGSNVSGAPDSAAKLRAMLDAVRRGQKASSATGSGQGAQPGRSGKGPDSPQQAPSTTPPANPSGSGPARQPSDADVAAAVAKVTGPRRRVLDALLVPAKIGISVASVINELIAALPPDLADAEATQLIATVSASPAATAEDTLLSVRAGVAALRENKGTKPGGLGADQAQALADAAKAAPPNLPKGQFTTAPPSEAVVGKTYGLQLVGRTSTGVAYACMASVRLASVTTSTIGGVIVAHSDGIGTDGSRVIPAGALVNQMMKSGP